MLGRRASRPFNEFPDEANDERRLIERTQCALRAAIT